MTCGKKALLVCAELYAGNQLAICHKGAVVTRKNYSQSVVMPRIAIKPDLLSWPVSMHLLYLTTDLAATPNISLKQLRPIFKPKNGYA